MRTVIKAAVAGYVVATIAAVAAILFWSYDIETIGAGLLVPIFILPGLIAYSVATVFPRFRDWRSPSYWLLAAPFPLYCFAVALFASPHARADGADEWALAFAIPALAACVACYSVMYAWSRHGAWGATANHDSSRYTN